jgi:hypothetical protein
MEHLNAKCKVKNAKGLAAEPGRTVHILPFALCIVPQSPRVR